MRPMPDIFVREWTYAAERVRASASSSIPTLESTLCAGSASHPSLDLGSFPGTKLQAPSVVPLLLSLQVFCQLFAVPLLLIQGQFS
jgi:hypothetical protein